MSFILCDVEGTTTSLSFVQDILFPYSYEKIGILDQLKKEDERIEKAWKSARDVCADLLNRYLDDGDVIDVLRKWIREDRKEPILKELQGLLWERGYKANEIRGHVYEDVPLVMKELSAQGHEFGVYSSGSVLAQKLLFTYSEHGDLTPFFKAHFDTSVGHKREQASYEAILRALKLRGEEVVFLSDTQEELEAAQGAGIRCIQVMRGERPASVSSFPHITDFNGLPELLIR